MRNVSSPSPENLRKSIRSGAYPFWFWNGCETETELLRQLELIAKSGSRGVVPHCRRGNRIEYLSGRWMDLMRAVCRRAETLGLKVWLYDEDGFPSGNAGGRVQKDRPDLQQHYLTFGYSGSDPVNRAYAAFLPETDELVDEKVLPAGTEVLKFRILQSESHVDTLNPECSARFLAFTHEKYANALGEYFGTVVEAVYTDDESFLEHFLSGLVWSPFLERAWTERFGGTIRTILPAMVENRPDSAIVRKRFFALARELFLRNFILPQREWCEKHSLLLVGHLCGDEGPLSRMIRGFGSPMPYLRTEHIPSVDDFLCDRLDLRYLSAPYSAGNDRILPIDGRRTLPLLTYKTAASAAAQFADNLFSSETFALLSWSVRPEFLRGQMLFELANGVNLFTHHAFYYTVGGKRMEDCPPSYFFQQPYYPVFCAENRRWTRIAELLRGRSRHADVLVVYPESFFSVTDGSDILPGFVPRAFSRGIGLSGAEDAFLNLLLRLNRGHIGFDLGDETSLVPECACVQNGKIRLGAREYSSVLLPPSGLTLLPETEALLREFRSSGGTILTSARVAELEPDIFLSGPGTEEIFTVSFDRPGFRETLMLNLSGRDLDTVSAKMNGAFRIYDPIADRICYDDSVWPNGFSLPAGTACMIVSPEFHAEQSSFRDSVYAPPERMEEIFPDRVFPDRPNCFKLFPDKSADLLEKLDICAIYEERTDGAPSEVWERHPCDPCFRKIPFPEFGTFTHPLLIEGYFRVFNGKPVPNGGVPPAHGNLAEQGWPEYWGSFTFVYSFRGVRSVLKCALFGAAEVFLNGRRAGELFGKPDCLSIREFCSAGRNEMTIRLFPSAHNFLERGEAEPFGILRTELR